MQKLYDLYAESQWYLAMSQTAHSLCSYLLCPFVVDVWYWELSDPVRQACWCCLHMLTVLCCLLGREVLIESKHILVASEKMGMIKNNNIIDSVKASNCLELSAMFIARS